MLSVYLKGKNSNLKNYMKIKSFYRRIKLDKKSKECKFFGTDSETNIQKQILNQCALSKFKTKDQNLVNLPFINVDFTDKNNTNKVKECILKLFNKENTAGRVTILSKFFGKNKTHTIGLVEDNNKLYVLDSLPESYRFVKEYHKKLSEILGIIKKKIVFVSKMQQTFDEFTCNNWAHSNIETVLKLKKGTKFLTKKIIEKNLLNDINQVLRNQKKYVEAKLDGKNICDIVAERMSKRNLITNP